MLIHLKVMGPSGGEHAAHIHTNAKCEGPAFTSAGGHFNPEMKHHGLDNPRWAACRRHGEFQGDGKKGKANVTLVNTRVTLDNGDHSMFRNGGTALVIHAEEDDMKSDPAGNAGDAYRLRTYYEVAPASAFQTEATKR